MRRCVATMAVVLAAVSACAAAERSEESLWGQEPQESITRKRGEICLNGIWRFVPAVGPAAKEPGEDWGYIRVPGDWRNTPARPGIVKKGTGEGWAAYRGDELAAGWYEREFVVPKEWDGRAIMLDFQRLSTDAVVFVNNRKCGTVTWPGNQGSLDITSVVKWGEEARLRLLVGATEDEAEGKALRDQGEAAVLKKRSNLESRGIIGDVTVRSRPKGPHVRDVFVQTFVRENLVLVDVEMSGIKEAGVLHLVARMLDEKGNEEKRFERDIVVPAKDMQTVGVAWKWHNPRLWDFGQGHQYTCKVEATGVGVDDEYAQPFGFREFWIEGRKFILNGREFRLRPAIGQEQWSDVAGTIEILEGQIDGLMKAGFNIEEHWPIALNQRGMPNYRSMRAEVADRKGWPLMGSAVRMNEFLADANDRLMWDENDNKKKWEAVMAADLRKMRNHPSILMWNTSANLFGFAQDQNPVMLGRRDRANPNAWAARAWKCGEEAAAVLKKHDPTRPIYHHQGGYVGDVHTINMYLCMLPLQEREEWVSWWATNGKMPFIAIEFGTPLACSFMRGRVDFGRNIQTEPLMTEFCATYLGSDAYRMEPKSYRDEIKRRFIEAQAYTPWHGNSALETAEAFQRVQELFIANTWRSWRTWGVTGGMVPWNMGHGWTRGPEADRPVPLPAFQPGRRGTYVENARSQEINYLKEGPWRMLPGGKAITANNRATLAWIAGPPDAFTAKDHSFRVGQKVRKQIVVINDSRGRLDYALRCSVRIAGQRVANDAAENLTGSIEAGQMLFFPIELSMPAIDGVVAQGEIRLTGTIGTDKQEDVLPFRVFQRPRPVAEELVVFDPVALTSKMLEQQGYKVRRWNGEKDPPLVLIGREALSREEKLPGDLEGYVRDGGRLLVFTQQPQWIRSALGLRVAEHLPRRAFAVSANHPVMSGLDDVDLRDWAGESALTAPRPDYFKADAMLGANETPYYGWHWGNRGAVSSAAIEKPHRSGWRPIVECEFDLAYSPLMELDYGKGRVIWCALDIEDHAGQDAAAAALLGRILSYARGSRLQPRARKVVLLGNATDAAKADALGLIYRWSDEIDSSAELTIIGAEAGVDENQLAAYVSAGGRALVMARGKAEGLLGVKLAESKDCAGALNVPDWEECQGLSVSDLRWRTESDAWLVKEGAGVGAGGLLARVAMGKGVAIICQIDPDAMNADQRTYLRYTRWRQTRAITQILANMGASFAMDQRFFRPERKDRVEVIPLAELWRAKTVVSFAPVSGKPLDDPGISDQAMELVKEDLDHGQWPQIKMPTLYQPLNSRDGEAVFRKSVQIHEGLVGREMTLSLGVIDDYDDVYVNGVRIGGVDRGKADGWKTPRLYTVPANLLKPGRNVIAVRVWDKQGNGGFSGPVRDMFLRPKDWKSEAGFYHADYRDDFELGDDPYRYYRW